MKKALELHKSGNSIVVPLIIRPCDWTSAEFGSIQGLPKDAIPVSKWENEDDAWLNAVNGIKRLIGNISEKKTNHFVIFTDFSKQRHFKMVG